MGEDNMYPNDGSVFLPAEPADQKARREREESEAAGNHDTLEKIIERLDERIGFYGSVDSVEYDYTTNPEAFMHVFTANKMTKDNLQQERDALRQYIDTLDQIS